MRKFINYIFILALVLVGSACEYFEAQTTSGGTTLGLISFPSITINGDTYITLMVGESFEDPGATATLGSADISDQIVVDSDLDTSTPGVYTTTYSVSNINELGEEDIVSTNRYLNVVAEDVSDIDLSGDFLGVGFSGAPVPRPVEKLANGWFQVDDILGSGNNIRGFFAVNGDEVILPDQSSPFGNINTIAPGTYGTLGNDKDSWEWVVFIGCCGNFGPINWTRQ